MLVSEKRRLRELEIMSILGKLQIAHVGHLMALNAGGLGESGRRNALRVLREMENDGYLDSKRVGVKLFRVSGGGSRGFHGGMWEHTILRNDFVVWKGREFFENCRFEVPIRVRGKEVLRADIGIQKNGRWLFYEIDRLQKRSANILKIENYKKLNLDFKVVCYRDRLGMWSGCQHIFVEDFK